MRISKFVVTVALATVSLALTQVSAARQQPSTVVATCKSSLNANWYDCDCFGREEPAARQALAQEKYDATRKRLEGQLAAAKAMAGQEAYVARLQGELAANKVDAAKVSPESVVMKITGAQSTNMCKSPSNTERSQREACLSGGKEASLCACVSAEVAKLWISERGVMSQAYSIDLGTRAQLSCQPGAKPAAQSGSAPPKLPSTGQVPSVSLPSIPGVKLPTGSLPIPLPGNSSTPKAALCGFQVCSANQKCVTENVLGVSVQQCR